MAKGRRKQPLRVKAAIMEKLIEHAASSVAACCTTKHMSPEDAKVYLECVIERLQQGVEKIEEEHGL